MNTIRSIYGAPATPSRVMINAGGYPREANNFVTLLVRSGRFDESLDVAQKLAHTMRDLGSNYSETMNLAVWSNVDRLLFRAGDKDGARAAFQKAREQLETLSRFRMSRHWPLESGEFA